MKIRKVLIIDDSAVVRQTLEKIFNADSRLEVLDTAADPYFAVAKIKKALPDVITLDIEMPRMDGITFLKTLMAQHPIPVVIISSLTEKGTITAFEALQSGAVEVLNKPKLGNTKKAFEEACIEICDTIHAASFAKVSRIKCGRRKTIASSEDTPEGHAPAVPRVASKSMVKTTNKIVAVGASTGGTAALRVFLEALPYDAPGIVIVQHMPAQFTQSFAERLNSLCKVSVKEARQGDPVLPGSVLIAPGNYHLLLKRSGARYFVQVRDGELINRHRPAVDVLFHSVAQYAGKNSIGIILTGMGGDGAKGLLAIKESGGYTIAQDEVSSVVFGMPNEAIKLGGVESVLPLHKISQVMLAASRS